MSGTQAALIWCPFPDRASAKDAAEQLLSERLIACANILPGVTSVFEWEGGVSTGEEVGVLFKTSSDRLDAAIAGLGACHPYDTPAIIGWQCAAADPRTLQWIALQCHVTPAGTE